MLRKWREITFWLIINYHNQPKEMENLITSNTTHLMRMILKYIWKNKRLNTAKDSVQKDCGRICLVVYRAYKHVLESVCPGAGMEDGSAEQQGKEGSSTYENLHLLQGAVPVTGKGVAK